MAEWINCIECKERYRSFFRVYPKCKAQNHNSYETVVSNQHSKNILRGKAKKIISCLIIDIVLCSSIFSSYYLHLVYPPPITDF